MLNENWRQRLRKGGRILLYVLVVVYLLVILDDLSSIESSLSSIESDISSIQTDVSSIQSDVSYIEGNTETIEATPNDSSGPRSAQIARASQPFSLLLRLEGTIR